MPSEEGRTTELPMPSAVEIAADRVRLRKARDTDRQRLVELQTDPLVWAHLGGPRPWEAVEARLDEIGVAATTAAAGVFVIADKASDALIGTLVFSRRAADLPGHVTDGGGELELGYLLRPDAWGRGLALEAATAALRAAAAELPDQPVLIVTQTANERSMSLAVRLGFRPVGTFEQYDAEQTLAVADLRSFRTGTGAGEPAMPPWRM